MDCVSLLKQEGINPGMLHIANSCAFLQYRELHLDAVRVGSAFLGRVPVPNNCGLNRIACLKSVITEIKTLPPKQCIGYANTFTTRRETRIGIVPVGYMDGFGVEKTRDTFRLIDILRYVYNDVKSWRKSLYASVNGKKARVLGRINMFNIIVDLEGTGAVQGDEVILEINPLFASSSLPREYTGTDLTPLEENAL